MCTIAGLERPPPLETGDSWVLQPPRARWGEPIPGICEKIVGVANDSARGGISRELRAMPPSTNELDPDMFLEQTVWLQRLAARLVSPQDADDLVQDTFVAVAAKPPARLQSPRGWLGQVARNVRRMGARAEGRRRNRESKSVGPEPWPEPEELVARSQRLRRLCEAVESLDEPFRSTILRHYFEGQTLVEIARRESCPAATVRGRLKTGLARLRSALDRAYGGSRADWLCALAPVAAMPRASMMPASGVVVGTSSKLVMSVAAVGLAAGCATMAWRNPTSGGPSRSQAPELADARATKPGGDGAGAGVEDLDAAPVPTPATTQRSAPDDPGVSMFRDDADRERRRAAVHEARVARLRAEGMDASFVDEVSADQGLLNVVESMMMMEDAGRLATGCAESSPPQARGKLYANVEFIGEPDVGIVIEAVELDDTRSTPGMGEFAECVQESLFMLSLAPPAAGGTQTKTLFFDTRKDPVLTGTEIRPPVPPD